MQEKEEERAEFEVYVDDDGRVNISIAPEAIHYLAEEEIVFWTDPINIGDKDCSFKFGVAANKTPATYFEVTGIRFVDEDLEEYYWDQDENEDENDE